MTCRSQDNQTTFAASVLLSAKPYGENKIPRNHSSLISIDGGKSCAISFTP
jgi:hypothetical protein